VYVDPAIAGPTTPAAATARAAAERSTVAAFAGGELTRARVRFGQVEAALDAAQVAVAEAAEAERRLADQHLDSATAAGQARRDLGNMARLAYSSGPTEWTMIEAFLEGDSPGDALRGTAQTRLVAERQDSRWRQAVELVAQLERERADAEQRRAAAAVVATNAAGEVKLAAAQVADIVSARAQTGVPANGASRVAALCGDSAIPQCSPTSWGEGSLTRDAVWLMRVVALRWPQIDSVGGYRPVDAFPDHPTGRAVDVMLPSAGRTAAAVATGDEIATHLMENADRYGLMYVIWRQRIWMNGRDPVAAPSTWRSMADRGDWTSNHMDHVHATVSTGASGSDIRRAVAAGR